MVANTDGFVENGAHRTRKSVFSEMARPCLYRTILTPVLYTVGLQATFWNMNSSVWAAQAVRGKKWI